ncbi:GTP-binding protein [Candidatus Saccharibacteria bacterium]|nr:GTP-binding protein [Candidatus Saccharibacteria bacterium]
MSEKLIQYKKIPITVLTGFLGAGKTTLLNYILQHNQGMNIGVVVNDFGDINIDSELIKSKTDKRLELTSGCICCSLQTLDLQDAIEQFTYANSGIDYIIIEASGLAEPRDLAMTLRHTLGQRVRLDSIVAVLDAENLEDKAKEHNIARDQILFSDFVIINKIDLVKPAKVKEIRQLVEMFNPKARIVETTKGEVDVRLLLDQDLYKTKEIKHPNEGGHEHDHSDHIHHKYSHFSFTSDKPLHPMKFQEFINRKLPTQVYRAKGFVDFGSKGHQRKYIFQLVGVRPELVWENWLKTEQPKTRLVFIGQDVNEKKIRADLEACIDPEPSKKLEGDIELRLPKKADL